MKDLDVRTFDQHVDLISQVSPYGLVSTGDVGLKWPRGNTAKESGYRLALAPGPASHGLLRIRGFVPGWLVRSARCESGEMPLRTSLVLHSRMRRPPLSHTRHSEPWASSVESFDVFSRPRGGAP
jgi:hypothetical protein